MGGGSGERAEDAQGSPRAEQPRAEAAQAQAGGGAGCGATHGSPRVRGFEWPQSRVAGSCACTSASYLLTPTDRRGQWPLNLLPLPAASYRPARVIRHLEGRGSPDRRRMTGSLGAGQGPRARKRANGHEVGPSGFGCLRQGAREEFNEASRSERVRGTEGAETRAATAAGRKGRPGAGRVRAGARQGPRRETRASRELSAGRLGKALGGGAVAGRARVPQRWGWRRSCGPGGLEP